MVGARGPIGVVPRPVVTLAGFFGGLWTRLARHEPEINPVTSEYGSLPHYFASDRAKAELGHGETDFEAAVGQAWEWLRARGLAG